MREGFGRGVDWCRTSRVSVQDDVGWMGFQQGYGRVLVQIDRGQVGLQQGYGMVLDWQGVGAGAVGDW